MSGDGRFSAVLFDVGGVLVVPDPVAIRTALEPFDSTITMGTLHRAHYAGLYALEMEALANEAITLELLDWSIYRRAYCAVVGIDDDLVDAASDAMNRIWSPSLWNHRIEESVASLWRLRRLGVPLGIVSNASGQVEGMLRYQGICQVGDGGGCPVVCVVDSTTVGIAKPDPRIFDGALAVLGNPDPASVAYVGDSLINDVGGALAAGLTPLHLDPYGNYAAFDHERITSLSDVVQMFTPAD